MDILIKTFMLILVTSASHAMDTATVQITVPGCYQLSNTAVQTAISRANKAVNSKCKSPILFNLEVDIEPTNGCTPVSVTAEYSCLGKISPWCEARPSAPCCVNGEYICF